MQPEGSNQENQQPTAGWVFRPGDSSGSPAEAAPAAQPATPSPAASTQPQAPPSVSQDDAEAVRWTASEYVAHDRGSSWYLGLAVAAVAMTGLTFLLTRDYISSGMIIIVAVMFGIFAGKKPRVLEYVLDDAGITIGQKSYPYHSFKSFSVSQDGGIHSLMLMPLKRFMPLLTVYYDQADEAKIIPKIASFLPFEEYRQDPIDKLMHKVRF